MVVGFAAGGNADFAARLISQWLSERLGQQFVIENRPGAGGNIAAEAVVRAPADGYTLLALGINNAFNTRLYDKLSFNFLRDIAPVTGINSGPAVLVVHPSFQPTSVPEFIAYVKANPGKFTVASGGHGSFSHLCSEMFKAMTGINLVHVPYRGAGQAISDLIGGQVQAMFNGMSETVEHIRAGKLRPLALTTLARSEALPGIPTIGEFVPGYEASGWNGIGVARNTPAEIVEKLNNEINAALAAPNLKTRLADVGSVPIPMTTAEFGKFIADETEKWGKVIRAANIKL
jgi:tripartite-type tricarboxylate transporter receptor subunit TctC